MYVITFLHIDDIHTNCDNSVDLLKFHQTLWHPTIQTTPLQEDSKATKLLNLRNV